MTAPSDQGFDALLEYLKRNRGFDFSGYKAPSLMRRIQKRVEGVGLQGYGEYVDYLEVHPEEFAVLFNTILINVTAFFRDTAVWEFVAAEVIPRIIKTKHAHDPVRAWSAGCASGEEAYTLAMLLAEALGLEAFRERIKIYGTDVDEEALNQARQASYSARDLESVPAAFQEKYFERSGERYTFLKELRRSVIFGRHDLLQDAPISRLDLLVCRNTLMYFNAEAQARIIDRFHFALNDPGYLLLGKAEMLLSNNNTYTPFDLKRRVFAKVLPPAVRERHWITGRARDEILSSSTASQLRIREAAFDAVPVPTIVVDPNSFLILINQPARAQFGMTTNDIGRPLQDLEISYRPAELRSCVDQASKELRTLSLKEVEWRTDKGISYYNVQIVPLVGSNNGLLGVTIVFTDITNARRLQEELQRTNHELEYASEELQSTNEELETTNEELQSTVEELETTNEELQSTNEELETMNEEMQSANEELQTINEELRQRSDELNQANSFLESILASLRGGVAVVDQDFTVQMWNDHAEELWGLRSDEVRGKNFLNLDIGLPVAQLKQILRVGLAGETSFQELQLNATNRRGKAIQCRIGCTPLAFRGLDRRGVMLVMEEVNGNGKAS